MNVLVTGATGFVGEHLIHFMENGPQNCTVFAFSRNSDFKRRKNITWVSFTNDFDAVLRENKIDIIIHLAGKAHDTKNTSASKVYFEINFELTVRLYDSFLQSNASKFIFLSTIKALGDDKTYISNSEDYSEPQTPYAISKRDAEKYIQSTPIPENKNFYILRPTLIYGTNVKGNLATLVKFAKLGIPYPFAAFDNKRSYLSVNNLCIIFDRLIFGNYPNMTLNIANQDPISTKELMSIINKSLGKNDNRLKIPASIIRIGARLGDYLPLPLNTEKLNKITSSFIVDTAEMNKVLGIVLPDTTKSSISCIVK